MTANPAFPRCNHGDSPITCVRCLDDHMVIEIALAELEESLEQDCDECGRLVDPEDTAPSCGAHVLHIECAPWFRCQQCAQEQWIDANDDAQMEPPC
jgi:hypothetical protein